MAVHRQPEILRENVKNHFESLAGDYDTYKRHSRYYYSQLKKLLKELIPDHRQRRILEVGCGTGSLLADLAPARGMGVDIAENMVAVARERWGDRTELTFEVGEAETLDVPGTWDRVCMCDVLEHLYDPETAIRQISCLLQPGAMLIITWANTLWEPVLYLLEKLKMKMPEGDHNWESRRAVLHYLKRHGFRIEDEGTRCLIPAKFPGAEWINHSFYRIPGVRRLGLIRYIAARR